MSDVEKYWQAIATKAGDTRKWSDLSPQEQMMIVHSINLLIAVLSGSVQ